MHLPATPAVLLFAYAFLSNIALAVVPHVPAIIWYGPRLGVWTTTLAAIVDHRLLAPLIGRIARRQSGSSPLSTTWRGGQGVRTVMVALFALLMVPSLRMVRWRRAAS